MGYSRFGMNTLSKWLFSLKNGIFDFHDALAPILARSSLIGE